MMLKPREKQRQRAPSKRSLQTRERILDAAEMVFSDRGFEGASIRDIAALAGAQGALVHHHGGSKEELFFTTVARRADALSQLRLDALDARKASGPLDLRSVLACFLEPFLHKVFHGGSHWRAYGRLIAHVSADMRWREISAACFDPTVEVFLQELADLLPHAPRQKIGSSFVFTVSSMLSICASRWRIESLAGETETDEIIETLLDFCEAGFASIRKPGPAL